MGSKFLSGVLVFVFISSPGWAQKVHGGQNYPPPAGAILDLNGTPVPGGGNSTYQMYTTNFTATSTNTEITFAFRDDPAFIYLSNPSVTDLTSGGGNLLVNSNFLGGVYLSNGNDLVPVGWTYANVYGVSTGGTLNPFCPIGPNGLFFCWYDGAEQGYDALTQTIATKPGHNYQIAFSIAEDSGCSCNFSDVSTNGEILDGGNGRDVLV